MERYPLVEREILIRYGKLAPHARDRILDQFYLLVPGCASLQRYMFAQGMSIILFCSSIVIGLMGVCMALSLLFHWQIDAGSVPKYVGLILEIIFAWYVIMRRWKYQKRYREKFLQTTEIGLSNERLSLHSRIIHGGSITRTICWEDLVALELVDKLDGGKGESLVLRDKSGQVLTISLDYIQTIEERQILRDFIEARVRELDVRQILSSLLRMGKPDDVPFTKLWCQALQDARPRVNTAPLSKGYRLQDGRFSIIECIGGGGQGTVYETEMRELGETERVVLKEYVLPDAEHVVEHKDACEQFEKEIRILGKINHPGVIKLIDAFVEDHRAYLVLQHVDGLSLKEYVHKHGPLDQQRVVNLAVQACEILEHLHSMQPVLMHLDFSPENLLYDGAERIVLIDFNISVEENSMRTRTVMGKQRYMAPEQYRGQPSPLSDIYSLGATLAFLLTGVEPEPISVAKPAKHRDDVDQRLAELIGRATALEETQRIQTAAEFKQALLSLRISSGAETMLSAAGLERAGDPVRERSGAGKQTENPVAVQVDELGQGVIQEMEKHHG